MWTIEGLRRRMFQIEIYNSVLLPVLAALQPLNTELSGLALPDFLFKSSPSLKTDSLSRLIWSSSLLLIETTRLNPMGWTGTVSEILVPIVLKTVSRDLGMMPLLACSPCIVNVFPLKRIYRDAEIYITQLWYITKKGSLAHIASASYIVAHWHNCG